MDRYSPNCEAQEDTFLQLSSEMDPYFVGPLPPEEFLNQFMCQPSGNVTIHRPIFPFCPPLDHPVHSPQYRSLSL